MDEAHEWTEQEIERLTRDLEREYNQAAKEMRDKLAKMLADFDEENGKWRERLASGSATQKEYEAWLETRAKDKEFVSDIADTLAQDAVNADKRAMELVNNAIPTVYAENANRAAFEIDSRLGQDHSFDLYDQSTVRRLVANPEADLLPIQQPPIPNPKIDARKDKPWNKRKFSSAITQSILQGESIPNTAKRLRTVLKMDENAAVRAARTAMTGAENAGRVDSYRRAKAIGIDLEQEWMATLDMRTRHSHRELDGQHVPVGEKFKVDGIELEFPADPTAPPEYVYNCRCTLVAWFPDLDEDERWSKLPSGMTYDDWKNGKPLVGDLDSAVSSAMAAAAEREPATSGLLETIARQENLSFAGFDFRLKGEGSLRRKIRTDYKEVKANQPNISYNIVAGAIHDNLRYTLLLDESRFGSQYNKVVEMLEKAGYGMVRVKNTLPRMDGGCRGLNTLVRTDDGYIFELQFHTQETYEAKDLAHHFYEIERTAEVGSTKWKEAHDAGAEIFTKLRMPNGAEGIESFNRLE